MPLSEFSGATNQILKAWPKMARMKQAYEALSDSDIFAATVFKLRGEAHTYFHLSESKVEHFSLDLLAKVLRRHVDKSAASNTALSELWETMQRRRIGHKFRS